MTCPPDELLDETESDPWAVHRLRLPYSSDGFPYIERPWDWAMPEWPIYRQHKESKDNK